MRWIVAKLINTLIRSCGSRVVDFDIDNWPLKEYGRLILQILPTPKHIYHATGWKTNFFRVHCDYDNLAILRRDQIWKQKRPRNFFPPTMNERSFETKWHDHHQHNATGTYPRQDSYIRFPILSWISETVSLRRGNKS